MSSFGLIEENIELSHIHLAVLKIFVLIIKKIKLLYSCRLLNMVDFQERSSGCQRTREQCMCHIRALALEKASG